MAIPTRKLDMYVVVIGINPRRVRSFNIVTFFSFPKQKYFNMGNLYLMLALCLCSFVPTMLDASCDGVIENQHQEKTFVYQ